MKFLIILSITVLNSLCIRSQDTARCYPTNWWVGMKNSSLQLMIRGVSWQRTPPVTVYYPGVQLLKVTPGENPHYLFLDLRIAPGTRPGMMKIHIRRPDGTESTIDYPLLARRAGKGDAFAQGVTSADF